MTPKEILHKLEENRKTIRGFGVRRLGIFGSYARGEQIGTSDLDFLVEFDRATFDNYFDLKFFLEGLFGREVAWSSRTPSSPEFALLFLRKRSMPRDYRLYLDDILESCRKIRMYGESMSFGKN